MLMDFNYLYELDLKKIGQYLINYVNKISVIPIIKKKKNATRLNNPRGASISNRFSKSLKIVINNDVLTKTRELFISNLRLTYNSLTSIERLTIKNKLRILVSTIDERDHLFEDKESSDFRLREIGNLIRNEVNLCIADIISFLQDIESKQDNQPFENFLTDSGFYHIDMVKCLTEDSKAVLIDELKNKSHTDIPGFLAMLNHLGFDEILFKKYNNKTKAYKVLADVLKRDSGTIKGHISSFDKKNLNARRKYTAFKKLDDIKDFYNDLKKGG